MAKKHAGNEGRAVGVAIEEVSIHDEDTATMPARMETPISSIGEAIDQASEFTQEDVETLKRSGHAFRGGFQGALDLGAGMQVKGRLDPKDSDTLRRIFLALNRSNARLKDGRHVTTAIDTVRWLLEDATRQIEERIGA